MHKLSKHLIIQFGCLFLSLSTFAQETTGPKPVILGGARNDLNAAAMSPAKYKRMAVAGWDNEVLIYQADSPFTLVQKLLGHQAPVNCLAYNFSGNMFASGGSDNTVKVYDSLYRIIPIAEEGLNKHLVAVHSLLFDRSGKYLFSGDRDGKLVLWDLLNKKSTKFYETGNTINDLCLSPNAANIFIAHADPKIKLYALAGGKLVRTLDGHTDAVNSIAISVNNKYLISGSNDKTARIWDLKTMKSLFVLNTECWKVMSVGFTDDSKYCYTGCNDGSVRVWETETGKLISKWSSDDIGVKEVVITKNNQYLLIAPRVKGSPDFGARVIPSGIPLPLLPSTNSNNKPKVISAQQRQLDSIMAIRPLTKQDSVKYKNLLTPSPSGGNSGTGSSKSQTKGLDSAVIYKTPMNNAPVKKLKP